MQCAHVSLHKTIVSYSLHLWYGATQKQPAINTINTAINTSEPSGANLEQHTCLQLFIGKKQTLFFRRDAHLRELKWQENPGSLEHTCNKDISEGEHGKAEMTMGVTTVALNFLPYNVCQNLKSLSRYFTILHATLFKEKNNQF